MAQNFADKRKMVERVLTNPDAIKRFRQADEGEEQVRGSQHFQPSISCHPLFFPSPWEVKSHPSFLLGR
jgi:hypothetical protein